MRPRRLLLRGLLPAALLLLLGAGYTALAARRAEREYPPLGKYVQASPTRLHYIEAGTGKPIVLLHGAFGASQDYAATLFPGLAPTHHLVAFDRPGHGWSESVAGMVNTPAVQAQAIHSALHALGIERPVLLGFSYGGSVALSYALQFPADCAGLVLINPAAYPWPGGADLYYSVPRIPLLGPLLSFTLATPIAHLLAPSSCVHAFAPVLVAAIFEARSPVRLELTPARFRANCEDMRVLADCLAEQSVHYPEIRAPTLLLGSEEDEVVSLPVHSRTLERMIRGAKLLTFSPAGHQLPYSHADEIARDVLAFLAENGL